MLCINTNYLALPIGYSSEQAILEITDNLNSAILLMTNKLCVANISITYSYNNDILLSKLYSYVIHGTPFKLFKSYFNAIALEM